MTVLCQSPEQVMGKRADRGMRCIIAERIRVCGMWHYQKHKHVTMRERWKWPSVARILHAYWRFGGVCAVLLRRTYWDLDLIISLFLFWTTVAPEWWIIQTELIGLWEGVHRRIYSLAAANEGKIPTFFCRFNPYAYTQRSWSNPGGDACFGYPWL